MFFRKLLTYAQQLRTEGSCSLALNILNDLVQNPLLPNDFLLYIETLLEVAYDQQILGKYNDALITLSVAYEFAQATPKIPKSLQIDILRTLARVQFYLNPEESVRLLRQALTILENIDLTIEPDFSIQYRELSVSYFQADLGVAYRFFFYFYF